MNRPIIKLSATQSVAKSQGIIREWLKDYGCQSFMLGECRGHGVITFDLPIAGENGAELFCPIRILVRTKAYAQVMLSREPWTSRKHMSEAEWGRRHEATAEKAAWSLASQKIQTDLSMVELGISTLEEVFLAHLSKGGQTIADKFSIQRFLAGDNPLLLTEGKPCQRKP